MRGCAIRRIDASCGVRLPFLTLHARQAQTTFSQLELPPRDSGMTWSSESSDDAVRQALGEARRTLRNIKAVDVVSVGLRGDELSEWRAHVRVAFLIDRDVDSD